MKKIAIMGEKGGIAKTTTAAALAYLLAKEENQRVLAVDADQQGNLSQLFGAYDPERCGMARLLGAVDGEVKLEDVALRTKYGVDIITANGYLMDTNVDIATDEVHDQVRRLDTALENTVREYDFMVADCGLLLDMPVMNVLVAADLLIVPVKPGGFEAEALVRMQEHMEALHQLNPALEMQALVVMVGKSKTHAQAAAWIQKESGVRAYDTTIRRSLLGEKYTAAHMPLPAFSPRCGLTQDYRALVCEMLYF